MLAFLQWLAGDRKLRLFTVACGRLMDRCGNTSGLAALELAEQVADGLLPLAEAQARESSIRRLLGDARALATNPFRSALKFAGPARAWVGLDRAALLR
jgi:hypothetical protein